MYPSLLPLYHGAIPVQRALQVPFLYFIHFKVTLVKKLISSYENNKLYQDIVKETAVSLAFTVIFFYGVFSNTM